MFDLPDQLWIGTLFLILVLLVLGWNSYLSPLLVLLALAIFLHPSHEKLHPLAFWILFGISLICVCTVLYTSVKSERASC